MKLYRYTLYRHSDGVGAYLEEFNINRETPKGYWITDRTVFTAARWISKTGRKRYAYPTIEEAAISFRKRRERYVNILKAQLTEAMASLDIQLPDSGFGQIVHLVKPSQFHII